MRGRSSFLRVAVPTTAFLAVPVALAAATGVSCGGPRPGAPPSLALAPSIIAPQDLINEIATYRLTVFPGGTADGSIQCTPDTGVVGGPTLATPPVYGPVSNASGQGCGGSDRRCFKDITSLPSSTLLVFAVTGYSDSSEKDPIALGCGMTTLNGADAEPVFTLPITMQAIPQAETCGDGILQPPETCDPPTMATDGGTVEECTSTCQTVEQLLSSGTGSNGSITVTGSPGDKSNPSFLWPLGDNFLSFFTDASSGSLQLSMRLLSNTLAPSSGLGLIVQTESIYLPNTPNGTFPPSPEAQNQKQPVAVTWNENTTYVVFADDTNNSSANDDFGIRLRGMDSSLNALQANACDVSDTTNGESGSLTAPAVAVSGVGTSAVLFIAWQDDSGNIYGRTYTPDATGACGTLGAQSLLSNGTTNSHVSVAAILPPPDASVLPTTPQGWVAVWQSGDSVVIRAVGPLGNPEGTMPTPLETTGHTASSPSISSIVSESGVPKANVGGFAIAWADQAPGSSATTIYAERFYNTGVSVDVDGATQISQTINGGGESTPTIASTPAVGGSYVVSWVDQGSGAQVRARLLAGTAGSLANAAGDSSGYLHNAIDGTTGEFQVSVASDRIRVSPTVASGGGGGGVQPFIAFGWADNAPSGQAGVIARRFPLPTQ